MLISALTQLRPIGWTLACPEQGKGVTFWRSFTQCHCSTKHSGTAMR